MYIHTVLWNLQEGKTKEDYKKIAEALLALTETIEELKRAEVGFSDFAPDESTRQICLLTYFDSEEDYIVYRDHEEHMKVKAEIQKVFKDRVVSDVWAQR